MPTKLKQYWYKFGIGLENVHETLNKINLEMLIVIKLKTSIDFL